MMTFFDSGFRLYYFSKFERVQ